MKRAIPLGRPPALEEVWHGTRSRIEVNPAGCWMWTGTIFYGYGPYRRLYERYVQPLPAGHDLHHLCRNGTNGCVNPAHLEVLTTTEHRTMHARERGKLTVEDARAIRELLTVDWTLTHEILAERYGVTSQVVDSIAKGEYFKELGGPIQYAKDCPLCKTTFVTHSRRKRFCCVEHQIRWNDLKRLARKRAANAAKARR